MPDAQRSVARQVRDYLDGHPTVAEALRLGIANHSAVARRIAGDLGWTTTAGVIAACRRYPSPRRPGVREEGIHRVLRKSRIETRTKVATVTVIQGIDVLQALGDVVEELLDDNALCRVIQVSQGTVIIVDEDS
ncbi:aspartokinase beta subunit, partial [mine drainage metagenome]